MSRWVTALPDRAGRDTVEENLADAAMQLASLRDQIMPLELAIAADPELAAHRRKVMADAGSSMPPGPPEPLAAYLAAEQRLGLVLWGSTPREHDVAALRLQVQAILTVRIVGDPDIRAT
jgi:hypothetical protein